MDQSVSSDILPSTFCLLPSLHGVERVPGSIPLEMLGHDDSHRVLNGEDIKGDRSDLLTTAISEWSGWFNWCHHNNIPVSGTVENLAHYAGEKLGIDGDRIDRILATMVVTAVAVVATMVMDSCLNGINGTLLYPGMVSLVIGMSFAVTKSMQKQGKSLMRKRLSEYSSRNVTLTWKLNENSLMEKVGA